jgi:hypothetical protein
LQSSGQQAGMKPMTLRGPSGGLCCKAPLSKHALDMTGLPRLGVEG